MLAVDAPPEADMQKKTVWGLIDARPITFPAEVQDAAVALVAYDAPPDVAEALGVGDRFAVEPGCDGTVPVTLMLADYRRAAWGASAHVSLSVPARPLLGGLDGPGAPDRAPARPLLCQSVTNTAFYDQAMYWALGVSGALGSIVMAVLPDTVAVRVAVGREHALTVTLPRPALAPVAAVPPPGAGDAEAYTCVGDRPRRVRFRMDVPPAEVDPAVVTVEPGTGPLADAVRSLQAAGPPTSCRWGERLALMIQEPHLLVDDAPRPPTPGRAGPARLTGFHPS